MKPHLTFLALTIATAQALSTLPGIATAAPPGPAPCSITPTLGFGRAWAIPTVRHQLGCAQAPERFTYAAYQPFQRGFMLWRDDTDEILIFSNDGGWQRVLGTWREGQPERAEILTPPPGLQQPKRGFGEIWLRFPEVRAQLGWALVEEVPTSLSVQPFEGGLLLWSHQTGVLALPTHSWYTPLKGA